MGSNNQKLFFSNTHEYYYKTLCSQKAKGIKEKMIVIVIIIVSYDYDNNNDDNVLSLSTSTKLYY